CGRENFIYWHFELTRYFETINMSDALLVGHIEQPMAMHLLRFFIAQSEQDIIAQCNNPKEAIDKLRATYYPNTLENHATIRASITNTHHGGMAKTEHFLFKICHHFRELHISGAVVTDRDIMATLLYKLPAEFDHLIPKLN